MKQLPDSDLVVFLRLMYIINLYYYFIIIIFFYCCIYTANFFLKYNFNNEGFKYKKMFLITENITIQL